jgi:hypothetical protein
MLRSLVIFLAYVHDAYETIRELLGIVPPRETEIERRRREAGC